MKEINLYETIFKRKSIRKYDLNSIDQNTLNEISSHMNSLKPLYDNIKTEMKIIGHKEVKNLLPIKAPHYIVAISEIKKGYLTNVGFMLQQMDLFLSANGIGSCWLGLAKPTKEILNNSELEFVIILAFGKPLEPLHRESVAEFKRKNLGQISNTIGEDQLFEAVRLAPSATNSQPWFFTGSDGILHVHCVKSNFIKAIIYEKMNKIDMGIGMCHLWIAANHFGKNIEFVWHKDGENKVPNGYYYVATAVVHSK